MNMPNYYDDFEQQGDDNEPYLQTEYYTRRLTDLTNVLYVSRDEI
jgi:hypothetical protein